MMLLLQLLQVLDPLVLLGGVQLRVVHHGGCGRLLHVLAGVLLGRVAAGSAIRRHNSGILAVIIGGSWTAGIERRSTGSARLTLLIARSQ